MKIFAKLLSFVFHPLFFPTYGLLLLLGTNPGRFGHFGEKLHVVWLIIIFALTVVFPMVWMLMMRSLEMIDSLTLDTTKDRIVPFIAVATFYLWTTWMFKANVHMKIPTDKLIFLMMLGCCFTVFLALVVNIGMKVNLHTMAAGNLLGLILPLIRVSTFDLRFFLVGLILLAGLIGAAQLVLNENTEREVLTGYFIGFTGQFVAFTIVPQFF